MLLDIRYLAHFRYEQNVSESHNELRACPASDPRQKVHSYQVTVDPAARIFSFTDYWGTRVDAFGVRQPHPSLRVHAQASVETAPATPPTSVSFDRLVDRAFREDHFEYLEPSPHTDWESTVPTEARRRAEAAGDDALSVVRALHEFVRERVSYVKGSTYVGVEVTEILERGAGVCQDFAHVVIALCRSIGIPARYVSGYLFAADETEDDAESDEPIEVETHAWSEIALPGGGWWPIDSVTGQTIGPRHVKIGHGRDYDDVAPLRGVFFGPPDHSLDVGVQVRQTREEGRESTVTWLATVDPSNGNGSAGAGRTQPSQ